MIEAWKAPDEGANETQLTPPPELFTLPGQRRWRWLLYLIAGVAAAFGAGTWAGYQRLGIAKLPPAAGLRIVAQQGGVFATWDSSSQRIEGLTKARLEVREGSKSHWKDLDREALMRGSEKIDITGREASVRLHGSGWMETARYVASREQTVPGVDSSVIQARDNVETELERQQARNRELENNLESLRTELKNRLSAAAVAGRDSPANPSGRPAQAASPAKESPAPKPQFSESLSSSRAQRPVPPAPVQLEATPGAAQTALPRGGRILWTGLLKPNTVLTIKGDQPSTGRISGALPGTPVRIRIMPATHSVDGLQVFSANSGHRTPEVDPPSVNNAWQRLTFQYDPRRAQEVQLATPPAAATGWTAYAIRARSQAQTAIIIEWELAR